MKRPGTPGKRGFTFVELLFAATLSVLLVTGVCGLSLLNIGVSRLVAAKDDNTITSAATVARMVYGYAGDPGLRETKFFEWNLTTNPDGWRLVFAPGRYLEYSRSLSAIRNQAGTLYASRVTDSYIAILAGARCARIGVQITHPGRKGMPVVDTLETNLAARN